MLIETLQMFQMDFIIQQLSLDHTSEKKFKVSIPQMDHHFDRKTYKREFIYSVLFLIKICLLLLLRCHARYGSITYGDSRKQ